MGSCLRWVVPFQHKNYTRWLNLPGFHILAPCDDWVKMSRDMLSQEPLAICFRLVWGLQGSLDQTFKEQGKLWGMYIVSMDAAMSKPNVSRGLMGMAKPSLPLR